MKVGIDARSLVGDISGVGNYLSNVLSCSSFEFDSLGYHPTKIDDLSIDSSSMVSESIPPIDIADRVLGPAMPAWWMNVTLPRSMVSDDIDCYFGPNFLKPIVCPSPSVIVVHDLIHRLHPGVHTATYRWYLRVLLPFSIRSADHIITVSNNTKNDILNFYDVSEDKITVAYPGASRRYHPRTIPEKTKTRIGERYGLPEQFVLFVGNIEPRKNLSTLVRALRELPGQSRLPLVVVGQDHVPDPELEQLLQQEWADELVYRTGYVSEEDLRLLYNLAEVFIYPSIYEGFGIPPLEAMQSGTPVITSNRSSLPEVVGNAGVTVDPTDVDSIATAIKKLVTDRSAYRTHRIAGLKRAEEFCWDDTATKIADAIRSTARDS